MRTAVIYVVLIAVAIAVAAYVSHLHPGGELPPEDQPDQPIQQQPPKPPPPPNEAERARAYDRFKAGAIHATLTVKDRGVIDMELYPQAAPKTVAHIVQLAKAHFYDGIEFHRVEPGFVAQAGDPNSKGLTPDQYSANGIGNGGSGHPVSLEVKLPHIQDSIGLARTDEPNSGDSQFFINLVDNPSLDKGYCAFGRIVRGADVADKIKKGDVISSFTIP